ncbi:MAG: SCO family protein [Psychroflexus sp.]|uniref:SCO family protein n=1 Tax=Psychroflexus sp. S27 TaxID=1982757 RepID=UPI000C2A3E78|nr:SCO family protein [Psychroflexus sp. S27]PJX21966.1 SCO family protein [Psychroflexus sp. S27]
MKIYKYLILAIVVSLTACQNSSDEKSSENNNEEATAESQELPDLSIYHLPSEWTTQNNENITLEHLKGDVLAVVMIYTSCKAACPRLVADMRNIQKKVSDEKNKNVKYVFVSIDPETDTPKRLKSFAKENEMDSDQWVFLRGTEEDTREFAAILAVSYKQISPVDFSHSNIISVFDQEGVLKYQKEGLGEDDSETIQKIEDLSNS